MHKKLQIGLLMVLAMILIASCAPKPSATAPVAKTDVPVAAESTIDEVAKGISEAGSADEDLDTSELDGVDSILGDVENI